MVGEAEGGLELVKGGGDRQLAGFGWAPGDGVDQPGFVEPGPFVGDVEQVGFDGRGDFVLEDGFELVVRVGGFGEGAGGVGEREAGVGVEEEVGEGDPDGVMGVHGEGRHTEERRACRGWALRRGWAVRR